MSLKLLSWNIEGRLTRFSTAGRGTPEHIVKELRAHDADVIILPEASDGDAIDQATTDTLRELGYTTHLVTYDDSGSRSHAAEAAPTMMFLSRVPIKNIKTTRYGDVRSLLRADVYDVASGQWIRVYGIHLDDRSEVSRYTQIHALCQDVQSSPLPVVLAGDFNAMHASDRPARLLRIRALVILVGALPQRSLLRSLLERVIQMASGLTLEYIERTSGLRDVDSLRRATSTPKLRGMEWLPSFRLLAIDHIYIDDRLEATEFRIARDGGADHRALSVTLSLKV